MDMEEFYTYCLKPAIHRRDIIRQQCANIDCESSFAKPMPEIYAQIMGTNADTEKLKELYQSLDRLKASGEDVIAEIRREINNIELQYLKDNLFPEIMKIIGERISWLRCTIDMSLQFDGDKQIDYSFC